MAEEFSNTMCHRLSPFSRSQRGNLEHRKCTDTSEENTSITNTSVFLEIRSNRSSCENLLQLDCLAFRIAIFAFKALRFDYSRFHNALHDGSDAVLNALSARAHAGVLGA
jgi:hypothetical protein